jgi:hypothetical protein
VTAEEVWLGPATSIVHLEYNAGEDVDVEVVVVDDFGVPVPLTSAVATIGLPRCPDPLHQWTAPAGNLVLLDQATRPGSLLLHSTAEQTAAWFQAWGDAEWQLDVVDLFHQSKRACEGDVRVNPSRRGGAW